MLQRPSAANASPTDLPIPDAAMRTAAGHRQTVTSSSSDARIVRAAGESPTTLDQESAGDQTAQWRGRGNGDDFTPTVALSIFLHPQYTMGFAPSNHEHCPDLANHTKSVSLCDVRTGS